MLRRMRLAFFVTAMIALAHSLDCRVVAEDVKTTGQLAFLWRNQCDMVQGYYIGQPLADTELEVFPNHRL